MAHFKAETLFNKKKESLLKENEVPNKPLAIITAPVPSPLDFVTFFPYMCRKLGIGEVIVEKHLEEPITPTKKKPIVNTDITSEVSVRHSRHSGTSVSLNRKGVGRDETLIQAYYNPSGRLVEICGNKCNTFTQKHIKALILCLPFHKSLVKINFSRCSINQNMLYEMGKLLSESNVTELSLDDTFCEQGNYYVLLHYAGSNLKRLSINRCKINDNVVKEIFSKLRLDSCKNLQLLEMSCNSITDKGALFIGNTLRTNRSLLHLNLAGNRITDDGAIYILNSLMEFELTDDEIKEKEERKGNYFKKMLRVYQNCYAEEFRLQQRQQMNVSLLPAGKTFSDKIKTSKTDKMRTTGRKKIPEVDISVIAAKKAQEIMGGPFKDVYDSNYVRYEDGKYYCKGNFRLASLNLGFNDLTHRGMKSVLKVLEYQTLQTNKVDLGLIRIVVDGNNLCGSCCIVFENISHHLQLKKAAAPTPPPRYRYKTTKSQS